MQVVIRSPEVQFQIWESIKIYFFIWEFLKLEDVALEVSEQPGLKYHYIFF